LEHHVPSSAAIYTVFPAIVRQKGKKGVREKKKIATATTTAYLYCLVLSSDKLTEHGGEEGGEG